jgi:imidazolonepropionase-like amidohydrolase
MAAFCRALAIVCLIVLAAEAQPEWLAVRGRIVTVGPSGVIDDGVVLVRDGRIEAVQPGAGIPSGYRTLGGPGMVIAPGFIDAHSRLGLAAPRAAPLDQELEERSSPATPGLRVIDAVRLDAPGFARVVEYGVTTVYVGPGSGSVIGGQGALVKTAGPDASRVLKPVATLECAVGGLPVRAWAGRNRMPTSRMSSVALLRATLLKYSAFGKDRIADLATDPDGLAVVSALSGEVPTLISAEREDEIESALRLADEFKLRLVVTRGGEAYRIADVLARAKVPVILGPMRRSYVAGGIEPDTSHESAAVLTKAGVRVALMSDATTAARGLPFDAALAMANGLSEDAAYRALTRDAAAIFGVDQRIGSIETGKDADLVVFSGSPFILETEVAATIVNGRIEYERARANATRPEDR